VIRHATALCLAALALAACGGTPPPTPEGTRAVTLELVAANSTFDKTELSVPADVPFAIEFENRDVVPHNVSIQAGPPAMIGEVFGGPAVRTYVFRPLPAGSYSFRCDLHLEMAGSITAVAP
jgi:plastocyanin